MIELNDFPDEPRVRVLICKDCMTAEELPNFEGRPENDFALKAALEPHRTPDGEPHRGRLYAGILQKLWRNPERRKAFVKQIWDGEGGQTTGMDPWVYNTVETLKEDAMACWKGRNSPIRCGDFHSDEKRLAPPTAEERKDAALGRYNPKKKGAGQVRFLCDYCVCRSQVEHEINAKNPNL